MAQFDVCTLPDGEWVVVVQADVVALVETTVIVPLLPSDQQPASVRRLHPRLEIASEERILATHLISAVRRRALSAPFASLAAYEYEIKGALDLLVSGI
ncbi:CcdB family protein [Sphingomonas rubra]|uniref:Toxin CcdB n=1 Tax=Sphingomonas rubra TaxID=634430 RepID=A0A1I5R6W3_9SPHN|nr:CcdB family protein [Sphingomonas rubra]SFP54274.1 toxin CcdB [Sphingomonas rubra]